MGLERRRAECVVPVFSKTSNLWPQAWHTLPRVVGQRFTQEEELALSSPAVWSDILLRLWLDYLMLKNPPTATTVMRIPVPTIRDGTCPLDAVQCCLVPPLLQSAAPTPHFLALPLAAARSLRRLSIQHREGSWGEGVQMTSVSHT